MSTLGFDPCLRAQPFMAVVPFREYHHPFGRVLQINRTHYSRLSALPPTHAPVSPGAGLR